MSRAYELILIAAIAAGMPRVAAAQLDDDIPDLLTVTAPTVPSVKHDGNQAHYDLQRDERVQSDLNKVIEQDSRALNSREHQLHEAREAVVYDSSRSRESALVADQAKDEQLEQKVTVLKSCLAAEQELAMEDRRDIKLDRQEIKLDGRE
jgi:hypothetical protein